MSGILGIKVGMTRIFQEDGSAVPVTVVKCEPNEITQVKTKDKDGYSAIVLGCSKLPKPKKTKKFYHVREFKVESEGEYKKGGTVDLGSFNEVTSVQISAKSKGKGFQGTIKRHNFARGPESHGSHHHREPGSVGACAKPARIHKGKKMAGRMGHDKVTLKNVQVAHVDTKKNLICLKGALPGPNGGLVTISKL